MSLGGHGLGVLLIIKWIVRWKTGYRPSRWGEEDGLQSPKSVGWNLWMTRGMVLLTFSVLGFALIHVFNARAEFHTQDLRFEYFNNYAPWLPHSYAQSRSFFWLHTHLALAWTFWALRDWLLGKSRHERAMAREMQSLEEGKIANLQNHVLVWLIPDRLRRFLWVVSLNGGILALESILQRLSGTDKLLWLKVPYINKSNFNQFGPYAYRSNGAQYLNLCWPVCVGFWLFLAYEFKHQFKHVRRFGSQSHFILIPLAVFMVAGPYISSARGGSIVATLMLIATAIVFWRVTRGVPLIQKFGAISFFVLAIGLGLFLGWGKLAPRLEEMLWGGIGGRTEIYETSQKIPGDFVWYGTGPNSFSPIYRLYKPMEDEWNAYVHDDWLEIRITFGRVGLTLILMLLLTTLLSHGGKGSIRVPARFPILIFVGICGILMHAKFDFPFRIYSLTHLTVLLCCLLHVTTSWRFGEGNRV